MSKFIISTPKKEYNLEETREEIEQKLNKFITINIERQKLIDEKNTEMNQTISNLENFERYLVWTTSEQIKHLQQEQGIQSYKNNINSIKERLLIMSTSVNKIIQSLLLFKENLSLFDSIALENTATNLLSEFKTMAL